jgi:hypothetical protein
MMTNDQQALSTLLYDDKKINTWEDESWVK